jgi:UDP-glucose 4-epimerase
MAVINELNVDALPKKWLITGGCGFIGTSLIKYLKKEISEVKIRVMDNLSVGTKRDLSSVCHFEEAVTQDSQSTTAGYNWIELVQLVVADIIDPEACRLCTQGAEIVVHLAANTGVAPSVKNPRLDMEANVIGTFNMLEASRLNQAGRFIFASSGAPIGEVTPPIHEELAPHPVSPYGASKLACEGYCSAYFQSFGLETVALRFGNVYGPRSKHKSSVVAKFIKKASKGQRLEIYGDGKQTRDFIYIEDLVRAIVMAATREGIGGEIFQIATNSETTVSEIAELLKTVFGKNGLEFTDVIYTTPRVGDVKRNFSNTTKAQKLLGWSPLISIKEGLENTVEWFHSAQF